MIRNQSGFTIEDLPTVSPERKSELQLLERQLKVRFKDYQLFNLAFCHRSYTNEVSQKISNNEKLEFLGDSVLGLSVVDYLYQNFPDKNEGELARIKSHVVSEKVLSEIGFELGVDNYILMGRGEEVGGGRTRKAVLEDCMEALFGAYFLDCGNFEEARKLVLRFLVPKIEDVVANRHAKDYKTLIQEYVQKTFKVRPSYSVVSQTGPDHAKEYTVSITIKSKVYGSGVGVNRKEAEQAAAAEAYKVLVEAPQEEPQSLPKKGPKGFKGVSFKRTASKGAKTTQHPTGSKPAQPKGPTAKQATSKVSTPKNPPSPRIQKSSGGKGVLPSRRVATQKGGASPLQKRAKGQGTSSGSQAAGVKVSRGTRPTQGGSTPRTKRSASKQSPIHAQKSSSPKVQKNKAPKTPQNRTPRTPVRDQKSQQKG